MRTTAKVEKPADVEVTIAITMTVSEWDRFRDQLQSGTFPSVTVANAVMDALNKIRRVVYVDPDTDA
jgi:hypothetical protein